MLDFLICYEHINREVENDSLLKHELNKRGYSCEIIPFNGPMTFSHFLPWGKAKVVVTPWLRYDDDLFHYLQFAKKPYKIVNLQWEQIYSIANIMSGMTATIGNSLNAYHLCWGENSRTRLINCGVKPEKAIITGAIQLDYGRKEFKGYYYCKSELAKEFNLDLNKQWILFVSSFSLANYSEKSVKILSEKWGDCITKERDLQKKSLAIIMGWIRKLLDSCNVEFIYRPHPSEKVSVEIDETEKKYKNFHVISKYSVKQWAFCSDKVDLWISTSNAEILSMGVDYCVVRPIKIPEEMEVESLRGSKFITTIKDFIATNSLFASNNKEVKQKIETLKFFYYYDELVPAYVITANALEKILKEGEAVGFHFSLRQKLRYGFTELKSKICSWLEETQMNFPKAKIIDSFPTRTDIKKNLKKEIVNFKLGKKIEYECGLFLKDRHI